jgi:hypothetical protein
MENVKLVAAVLAVITGLTTLIVTLHVTANSVPVVVLASCHTSTVELALIRAVVLTWHDPAPATAQENTPAGAAVQAATEGEAPVPTAAHLVVVAYRELVNVPVLVPPLRADEGLDIWPVPDGAEGAAAIDSTTAVTTHNVSANLALVIISQNPMHLNTSVSVDVGAADVVKDAVVVVVAVS